jgi:23S rRNA pseudouridine955/2504/2580 synthase
LKRMFLHAWRLRLNHPVTNASIEFKADLPAELQVWAQPAPEKRD